MARTFLGLRNPGVHVARNPFARARATVVLDGTSGFGEFANPTITVFTVTGRVRIHEIYIFCTQTLVSAGGGTLAFGFASGTTAWIAAATASGIATNDVWNNSGSPARGAEGVLGAITAENGYYVSSNIVATVGTADITAGTLVFDVWYEPVTEDGLLS